MRDDHLRSADYLDVEKYPAMTYRSTGVRQADGGDWIIDGELTLHGVTRPVPLALEVHGFGTDPWGGQRAGFSATARISRRDFGIGYADGWTPAARRSPTRCRSAWTSRPSFNRDRTRAGAARRPDESLGMIAAWRGTVISAS